MNSRIHYLARLAALIVLLVLSVSTQAANQCVQPPSGIIAWWPFDETSGNIAQDRAGSHTGAYANNPLPTEGKVGGSLRFNGTNYVAVPDSDDWAFGTKDFTIELWANMDVVPQSGDIWHPSYMFVGHTEGPFDVAKWIFSRSRDYLYLILAGPGIGHKAFPLSPISSPKTNQWYHLAFTRSGSVYSVFIDGVLMGSATNTDIIPNPKAPLTIGQAENLGFMNGRLDEVTIYNRAVTQAELQAIVNAGTSGKCKDIKIQPQTGGDIGSVSVRIIGSGFADGATVKLKKDGEADIEGTSVSVQDGGTTLITTFDLVGKTRGLWDVVLTNANNATFTLSQGFTIEEGNDLKLWTDILGLGLIRSGRGQFYSITYGNSGNTDVASAAVIIGIPLTSTTSCGLPNNSDIYNYYPDQSNAGENVDPKFAFVQANVGRIAPSETKVIQCKVNVSNINEVGILAAAFPDRYIISGVSYNITPETLIPAQGLVAQAGPRVKVVVFDGWGKDSKGNLSRITHPYVVVDGYVYTRNGTKLERWTLNQFEQQVRGQINRTGKVQVGDTINLCLDDECHFTWFDIPIDGDPNFPNLDPTGLKADLDAAVGNNCTTRGCIQCVNDITKNHGLPLLPQDLDPPPQPQPHSENDPLNQKQARGMLENLGIDPSTAPTQTGYNPEGKPFQPRKDFKSDWLRDLTAFIEKLLYIVFSFDPNDKVGAQGAGNSYFVATVDPLRYSVMFENLETASASAQEVVITDNLSPNSTTMDLGTLSLGTITFGDKVITPPSGQTKFATDVDLRPNKNLLVRINAGFDPVTNVLNWRFTSIDPATGELTTDPLVGFLPPNTDANAPMGSGSVLFTVMPKKALASGTEIRNKATIVFDTNAPIETPEWLNTIDNSKPESAVIGLPATQTEATFQVSWFGDDANAGVKDYSIFVSEDDGAFTPWLTNTPETQVMFTGQVGHRYAFYSVARDKVGNVEEAPTVADTMTEVTSIPTDQVPPIVMITTNAGDTVAGSGWYNIASSGSDGVLINVTASDPAGVSISPATRVPTLFSTSIAAADRLC